MKCKNEEKCTGLIDISKEVPMRTGCQSFDTAYPCEKCKRLHWKEGVPVNNRSGQRSFLDVENNQVSLRDKSGVEEERHPVGR